MYRNTEALHQRRRVTRWVNIEAAARRKLDQLHAAGELRDMAAPPGNRLEALSRQPQRAAQHPRQRSVPRVFCVDAARPDGR